MQTLLILIKLVYLIQKKKLTSHKNLSEFLLNDSQNQWDTNLVDPSINKGYILGRGVGFALSNEISLKFKELCQEMIEPFSSAEVMHGPKSLVQNSFKIFMLSMNDKSGLSVIKDSKEITNYTKLIYNISSMDNNNFYYTPNKISELDSITIMLNFIHGLCVMQIRKVLILIILVI